MRRRDAAGVVRAQGGRAEVGVVVGGGDVDARAGEGGVAGGAVGVEAAGLVLVRVGIVVGHVLREAGDADVEGRVGGVQCHVGRAR